MRIPETRRSGRACKPQQPIRSIPYNSSGQRTQHQVEEQASITRTARIQRESSVGVYEIRAAYAWFACAGSGAISAFYWGDDDTAAPYPPPGIGARRDLAEMGRNGGCAAALRGAVASRIIERPLAVM
jgi:hypothetical protein